MPVTEEEEVRRELAAAADLAAAPRFTAGDLVPRIRRRRRRVTAVAGAGVAVAAAVAVGVPVTLGGASQPGSIAHPSPPAPKLSYAVTVNGSTGTAGASWDPHRFAVTAGERLTITATLTVPPRTTAKWFLLGITNGVFGGRTTMRPVPANTTMNPVLGGSAGAPLGPGQHEYTLHWMVPATLRPGSTRELELSWAWSDRAWKEPGKLAWKAPGESDGSIAAFAVGNGPAATQRPSSSVTAAPAPGAPIPPAAVARLRTEMLGLARASGDAHPVSIRAVATTQAKAFQDVMNVPPGAKSPGSANRTVYLVALTGNFTLKSASVLPGTKIPTGKYLALTVDPATFTVMSIGVSNEQPVIPLRNLGPVSESEDARKLGGRGGDSSACAADRRDKQGGQRACADDRGARDHRPCR